jgi:hypothetical protein
MNTALIVFRKLLISTRAPKLMMLKNSKRFFGNIDLGDHYSFLMRNSDEAYDEYGQRFKDQLSTVTKIVKRAQRKGLLRKDLPEGWIACIMDFSAFAANSAIEHGSIKSTDARDILWRTLFHGIEG